MWDDAGAQRCLGPGMSVALSTDQSTGKLPLEFAPGDHKRAFEPAAGDYQRHVRAAAEDCRGLLVKQVAYESMASVNSITRAVNQRPVRVDVTRRIVIALSRIEPIAGLDAWMVNEAALPPTPTTRPAPSPRPEADRP